jgi:hypothetical protein
MNDIPIYYRRRIMMMGRETSKYMMRKELASVIHQTES